MKNTAPCGAKKKMRTSEYYFAGSRNVYQEIRRASRAYELVVDNKVLDHGRQHRNP